MSDILLQHADGPLLILTLNEPNRANPLSPEMAAELTVALEEAAADPAVRAVILIGAGKHFSAGADLAALEQAAEDGSAEDNLVDSRRLEKLFATLLAHPKLTVAAVHGAAIAGGCGMATACDLVVAEPSSKFCYTEVKIGFIPALVSTFLTRRVPGHRARRLLLDPEMLDGSKALDLGLVDELADEGQALEQAKELALSICRKASPAALAATKALMNRVVGMDWREALAVAAEANAEQRMHPECRRGVRSFLETKKTPDWLD
ncbi:MAG: hypothetical protein DRJ65_02405 [Acidobacteria bacterium]|nr:MAG: hypothetical protein DRJ65_02405 [Acidobacteriota bacterium]